MSALTWSARSRLLLPFFTFGPLSFFTYWASNTAGQGFTVSRNDFRGTRSLSSSTPALRAAS
jgi:hypothetical protein